MYSLLIVDPEQMEVDEVKTKINWSLYGFDVADFCNSGEEAVQRIEEHCPHIIFTELDLPKMTGFELIEYVINMHPAIKVVILSNKNEPQVLHRALKLRVFDYLLKPMTKNEFHDFLLRAKATMDKEKHTIDYNTQLKNKISENIPLLKTAFLNMLISAKTTSTEISKKREFLSINLDFNYFTVFAISINNRKKRFENQSKEQINILERSLLNIVGEITSKTTQYQIFFDSYNRLVLILTSDNRPSNSITTINFAKEMSQLVKSSLNLEISIGIGNDYTLPSNIPKSYTEAISALKHSFYFKENAVIHIKETLKKFSRFNYKVHLKEFQQILSLSNMMNKKKLDLVFSTWCDNLKITIQHPQKIVLTMYNQVLAVILLFMMDFEISESKIFDEDTNPYEVLAEIETFYEVNLWLLAVLYRVSGQLSKSHSGGIDIIISKAKNYISEKYSDSNFDIQNAASHVNLSVSYFSMIFKLKCGKAFQEYLIDIRLSKAKELLAGTNLMAYEISGLVGYNDPHYFCNSFKRYTGITTSEFRRQATQQEPVSSSPSHP